jgi:transcriptional regulator with XRE-family HTH domain
VRHGRYSTYQRLGCRCQPCRDDYFRYMKALKYDHERGIHRNVDAGPARERVLGLVGRGWTQAQIAATAGVWHTTVTRLVNHADIQIHRDTAAALLSVRLDQKPAIPAGLQDATGSARRLRALSWLGWTWPAIAERTGLDVASIARIAAGRRAGVQTSNATAIAAVYRQLLTQPAPQGRNATSNRRQARVKGWHGPMAWDDIDDPASQPHTDEPGERQAVGIDPDDVAMLARHGLSDPQIAARIGASTAAVFRVRQRHQIPAALAA